MRLKSSLERTLCMFSQNSASKNKATGTWSVIHHIPLLVTSNYLCACIWQVNWNWRWARLSLSRRSVPFTQKRCCVHFVVWASSVCVSVQLCKPIGQCFSELSGRSIGQSVRECNGSRPSPGSRRPRGWPGSMGLWSQESKTLLCFFRLLERLWLLCRPDFLYFFLIGLRGKKRKAVGGCRLGSFETGI